MAILMTGGDKPLGGWGYDAWEEWPEWEDLEPTVEEYECSCRYCNCMVMSPLPGVCDSCCGGAHQG